VMAAGECDGWRLLNFSCGNRPSAGRARGVKHGKASQSNSSRESWYWAGLTLRR